jgi:hypothetical protein
MSLRAITVPGVQMPVYGDDGQPEPGPVPVETVDLDALKADDLTVLAVEHEYLLYAPSC